VKKKHQTFSEAGDEFREALRDLFYSICKELHKDLHDLKKKIIDLKARITQQNKDQQNKEEIFDCEYVYPDALGDMTICYFCSNPDVVIVFKQACSSELLADEDLSECPCVFFYAPKGCKFQKVHEGDKK